MNVVVQLTFESSDAAASFLEAAAAAAGPEALKIEPTWTNSRGETFRLRDMPTSYLRNVLKFAQHMGYSHGPGCGLEQAIRRELARRTD